MKTIFWTPALLILIVFIRNTAVAQTSCSGTNCYYYMQPGPPISLDCSYQNTFYDPQTTIVTPPSANGAGVNCAPPNPSSGYNYLNKVDMTENFRTSNGQCLTASFNLVGPTLFGIGAGDTLWIHDGPTTAAPLIATFTNTNTQPTSLWTSTSNEGFTFRFKSDGSGNCKGWACRFGCVTCPSAPTNDPCSGAQNLQPGASCTYTAGLINSPTNPTATTPACSGIPNTNDDVWYYFVASQDTATITIVGGSTMNPVIELLSGTCGSLSIVGTCQNSTGTGGTEVMNGTGLTVGQTYYIRVFDYNGAGGAGSYSFNICVQQTTSVDCEGAIEVCNTGSFSHTQNNIPDNGTLEYNSSYWGCDVSGEIRSAWYYFQIATAGTFGFTVSGANSAVYTDCDFVLWGPLSSKSCPMNTTPLRCSYAIAYSSNSYGLPPYSTGLESGAADFTEGSGGDAFVQTVNATQGQWYVLMVNIYNGNATYDVTWMNNIPAPNQATFVACTGCNPPSSSDAFISANGATTFCNGESVVLSVASPGFTYQWKNGFTPISGATNQAYTATTSGSYNCNVSDSCGTTTSNSISVSVNPPPTSAEAAITAGGSTTICKGDVVELTVATPGLTYQWKKGNTVLAGATLQSFSAQKTGNYKCDVSNGCGPTTSNTISVTVNPLPMVTISQSPCSNASILLICNSNPNSGVTYQWKKGGANISGATNNQYNATENATYKCKVVITATGCAKTSAGSAVTITCKTGSSENVNELIIYPNPTSDYFNVNTSQLDLQSVISIYDLTGRLVESYHLTGEVMKVGASLSNGVYFLRVSTNSGLDNVIKLVKSM